MTRKRILAKLVTFIALCAMLTGSATPAQADPCTNRFYQCVTSSYTAGVSCSLTIIGGIGITLCVPAVWYTTNCWWEYYAIQGCGSN